MTPDRDFIAAMSAGIPPMHPDPIAADEASEGICAMEGLQSDNADIEVSESAFYPLTLPTLSPDEIAEGDARQEHC